MSVIHEEEGRRDKRGQWTIKSPALDDEMMNHFRLAAKKSGETIGKWAVRRLREAALFDLGKAATPHPQAQVPATLNDVMDRLGDKLKTAVEELARTNEQRMEQHTREMETKRQESERRMRDHYSTLVAQATVAAETMAENLTEKYAEKLNTLRTDDDGREQAHAMIRTAVNQELARITRSERFRRWRRG